MAASIDDAVRLLTDSANLVGIGRQFEGDYAVVAGSPVLRGLQELEPGIGVVAARGLIREALGRLDGVDQSYDIEVGGNRPDRVVRASKRADVYWVPRVAMREPS